MEEPNATGTTPAATAAAEPPELPPGTRSGFSGLRVGPKALFSVDDPIPNSSRFVFPITQAPASISRRTAVAVYGETYPSRSLEPQVVGSPSVQMLSLIATGTPARRPCFAASAGAGSAPKGGGSSARLRKA